MDRANVLSIVWLVDAMRRETSVSLSTIRQAVAGAGTRYEFVFVTRDVARVARRFRGADPTVCIVVSDCRGDGAALAAGCAAASGDYILPVVGDVEPDWQALAALVPFRERADVIAAYHEAAAIAPPDHRGEGMFGFLFGVTLREPLNPLKLYRTELLRGLAFVSDGATLPLELVAKAQAQGAVVTEVAARAADDALARPAPIRSGQVGRLWLHLRTFRPPWIVRARSPARPASEYACLGFVLVLALGVIRGWFGRSQQ